MKTTEPQLFDLDTCVQCSDTNLAADIGGELAILNIQTGVYYGLDEVGSRIWTLLQERRTVREIRDTILDEYAVDAARCEADLLRLLGELASHELITVNETSGRKV